MRTPLRYQVSEYDCGPTTFLNAVSFLFDIKEIQPDVIKAIYTYSLDGFNGKGEVGKTGTSGPCICFLSQWFNQYSKQRKFPIHCEYLNGSDVNLDNESKIITVLKNGGCALLKCYLDVGHYILATGYDEEKDMIKVFDPYYLHKALRRKDIHMVHDKPFACNRYISVHRLSKENRDYYNLGPIDWRESVTFVRTDGKYVEP